MPKYTQEHRMLELNTPLGKDVLLLSAFSGTETISRLFSYQLEMYSERDDISAKEIVGKNVTWGIRQVDNSMRSFNGCVSRFSAGCMSFRDLRHYRMEVVPWPWFLTRTANCKIYSGNPKELNVKDIIKKVFEDFGFADY